MPRVSTLRVEIHGKYTEFPGTLRERDVLLALERGARISRKGGKPRVNRSAGRPPSRIHIEERDGQTWRVFPTVLDTLARKGLVDVEAGWRDSTRDWDLQYTLSPHVTRVYATRYSKRIARATPRR